MVLGSNEVPDDWITRISDEEIKSVAARLVKLSLRLPSIKPRVLELVWLICLEDKRIEGNK